MTLNDFKSIEGDRRMGIALAAGAARASSARRGVACVVMAVPQVVVVALLLALGPPGARRRSSALLLAVQVLLMARLLRDPRELRALVQRAPASTLYVLGMLVSAFALRALVTGAA